MARPRIGEPVTTSLSDLPEPGEPLQAFRFASTDQGWPPLPMHGGETRFITLEQSSEHDKVLTSEQHLASALSDVNVTAALGERFTNITIDSVQALKGESGSGVKSASILFYSYSNASSVIAERVANEDWQVQSLPFFEPCEGDEEIRRAVELARSDERISRQVAALAGRVIHLPTPSESLGSGERVMLVTFLNAQESLVDENPPLFSAAVDLISEVVLAAGPLSDSITDGN